MITTARLALAPLLQSTPGFGSGSVDIGLPSEYELELDSAEWLTDVCSYETTDLAAELGGGSSVITGFTFKNIFGQEFTAPQGAEFIRVQIERIPGAAAPKLVTRAHLKQMKPGAVLVDIAIDQGGCFETSRATTHADPTFIVDGVVHYCVANMPGAVARTSTFALNNATIGHAVALATKGWKQALSDDVHLRNGLNVCQGKVTYEAVARDLGYDYTPAASLLV